jgi:hypothetical protein
LKKLILNAKSVAFLNTEEGLPFERIGESHHTQGIFAMARTAEGIVSASTDRRLNFFKNT